MLDKSLQELFEELDALTEEFFKRNQELIEKYREEAQHE